MPNNAIEEEAVSFYSLSARIWLENNFDIIRGIANWICWTKQNERESIILELKTLFLKKLAIHWLSFRNLHPIEFYK